MKSIQLAFSISIITFTNFAFSQAASINSALQSMASTSSEGTKCVQMLNSNNTKLLINPSPSIKAVLTIDPKQLLLSDQFKNLNVQERSAVVELINASKVCANHNNGLRSISKDLENLGPTLQNDKTAQVQIKNLMETHQMVSKTFVDLEKVSPDLAHFIHMHGM